MKILLEGRVGEYWDITKRKREKRGENQLTSCSKFVFFTNYY
jgi:hypothetical protein